METFLFLYCRYRRDNKELPRRYRWSGYLLVGIKGKQWSNVYRIYRTGSDPERIEDEKAPLRGIWWIFWGSFFSIVAAVLYFFDIVKDV